MLAARSIAIVTVWALLTAGVCAAAGDPVKDQLDQAKAARADSRAKARAALIAAMDVQVKSAGEAGDLDALKILTTQKDAFMTAGVLPNLPGLKDAVAQYTQSMRKADGALVAAYEVAIEAYTAASKNEEALAIRKERRALLDGKADLPAPDSPENIGILLDRSKADYQQAVADAKKAYLLTFDTRINALTEAGDLNGVTRMQAARAAVDGDAPLPEGVTDAAVLGARTRYGLTILSANQKLAAAYREAIRNFTRGHELDKAQAVQAEFDASGLGSLPPAGDRSSTAGGSEGPIKLTRLLPPFLGATGAFALEKDGIRPDKGVILGSKLANFLSKDFVFEVTVQIPKDEEWVVVGIGDTTEKGSMRVVIRNNYGWGRQAFLTHGDQWGQHIGDIHNGESYVIRLERHGEPITASVGSIIDGKFVADMSQTVSDIKAFVPDLTEKRAHVFFSGAAVFTQVRLASDAAATTGASGEIHSPYTPIKFPVHGAAPDPAAPAPAGAPDGDAASGIFQLNSPQLPKAFSATGTYSVTTAGLNPYDKTLIITKAADFLSRDFTFEATVNLPLKQDWIILGLGDGSEKGSLRLVIRPDNGFGVRAFLTHGDTWGHSIGNVRQAGVRVLRIERHGTPVTVSVGYEKDGKFEPEMTQTVADPKSLVHDLSERRAHLFFTGKAVWSEVRFVTGTDPAGPVDTTASFMPAKKRKR